MTSGPYALTRHPMYVRWWLIHLGAGTLAGSSWVVVTLPVGMLMDHLGVLREEAGLWAALRGIREKGSPLPRHKITTPMTARALRDVKERCPESVGM